MPRKIVKVFDASQFLKRDNEKLKMNEQDQPIRLQDALIDFVKQTLQIKSGNFHVSIYALV